MKKKSIKKKIGSIGVDAGQCWIGDPCYIMGDDASHRVKSWDKFCDKLNHDGKYTQFDMGISVSTGYGDGEYPVFAEFEDGRVKSVTVKFF